MRRHEKNLQKGAKIEPKTSQKQLPKTIGKKDAKKEGETRKNDPFGSSQKSEIGPLEPHKSEKCPTPIE